MKTPEYYARIGYEDHGYVAPELSSLDEYPEYLRREVAESAEAIRGNQTPGSVTFGFMTDLHYAKSLNHTVRMRRNRNSWGDLAARVPIEFLLMGGDYTNEGCRSYKTDCFRRLRTFWQDVEYYPANGNHDDGSIWEKSYTETQGEGDILSHQDLFGLFYDHLPGRGIAVGPDTLYYYFDDPLRKIRYVVLDTSEAPGIRDEEGHLKYRAQWYYGMSQKQLDWLCREALAFREEGWGAVVMGHSCLRHAGSVPEGEGGIWETMRPLDAILRARQAAGICRRTFAWNEVRYEVDADFTSGPRAEILALLAGDHHVDDLETDGSYPVILTANSVPYYVGGPTQVPRADGDKTELLFDVMTLDRAAREIRIVRIGAGKDRLVRY